MRKDDFAPTPPMGWNSYDYYDTTVTEEQVKENARYMAEHLKPYGWEYIVVDIEWYAHKAGSRRKEFQYIPFGEVEMDEWGRLLPDPERFPSSAGGKGFGPLAKYIHELGLKFGIHIMRGVPRKAAHDHVKIKGGSTADEIADAYNICPWNPDMYGLRPEVEAAQAYYDSLMELYAEWGVDFIKCDDICRMDNASCKQEIRMLHEAIEKCKRPIVLSLSPGPAKIEEAYLYEQNANMWRITDDFWDEWRYLKDMFARCEIWQKHVTKGCYPDCDMLPIGRLGKGFGNEWECRFTKEEQRTMMNLWCIFRSPLMIGTELTKMDAWTESLLTNRHLISCLKEGGTPRLLLSDHKQAVWANGKYLAVFNLSDEERTIRLSDELLPGQGVLLDAWTDQPCSAAEFILLPHGSVFLAIN
ncbi:MAG: glycoside hydrolase family 27 protein [Lachnospiraceae bacterium]|nr:glycoside hydrolase family 27 protein [Lachnospiraceae bacterium]